MPDGSFGPYEALNPRHIWVMVVLISGVSLAGYVALLYAGVLLLVAWLDALVGSKGVYVAALASGLGLALFAT